LFKDFGQRTICRIVNSLKKECYRENFLEMWKTNATRIESVTIEEIIEKVNSLTISPESGHATSFKAMLGGVEYDKDGRIISAKSIVSNWMLKVNFSQIDFNKIGNKAGTEDYTTIDVLRFEAKFLETIQKLKKDIDSEDLELFYSSGRSFGDISSKTMFQDIDKVVYGVIFMMIYMVIVLSKYSWVEIRYSLAAVGLLNVGMAYVSGCGMASIFFSYSPVHTSLFFIIMVRI
jgi:Niemann-Pick C1 protein